MKVLTSIDQQGNPLPPFTRIAQSKDLELNSSWKGPKVDAEGFYGAESTILATSPQILKSSLSTSVPSLEPICQNNRGVPRIGFVTTNTHIKESRPKNDRHNLITNNFLRWEWERLWLGVQCRLYWRKAAWERSDNVCTPSRSPNTPSMHCPSKHKDHQDRTMRPLAIQLV